ADLFARESAQPEADRITPTTQTAVVAAKSREVAVTRGHVGDRIECCGAGEELGMAGNQQQRLLAAHARSERVDPERLDPQPRNRGPQDPGPGREDAGR